jgi:hypothetical protein
LSLCFLWILAKCICVRGVCMWVFAGIFVVLGDCCRVGNDAYSAGNVSKGAACTAHLNCAGCPLLFLGSFLFGALCPPFGHKSRDFLGSALLLKALHFLIIHKFCFSAADSRALLYVWKFLQCSDELCTGSQKHTKVNPFIHKPQISPRDHDDHAATELCQNLGKTSWSTMASKSRP